MIAYNSIDMHLIVDILLHASLENSRLASDCEETEGASGKRRKCWYLESTVARGGSSVRAKSSIKMGSLC
eukprot:scaffold7786_cov162-Skeletonema_marinoi.AAC.6